MPFEHSKKRIAVEVGILAGGVAALVLLAWALVSGLVELGARHAPVQVEQALGKALAALVRQGKRPCESAQAPAAVESMARGLAKEAGLDDAHLEVAVLNEETVNAFALPGGYIFVFTGLLAKAESRTRWPACWRTSWATWSSATTSAPRSAASEWGRR